MKGLKKRIGRLKANLIMSLAPKPMVISYPKCGRTWIANVLLNYIQYCKLPKSGPLDFSTRPDFKELVIGTQFEPVIFGHDVFSMKIPISDWPRYSAVRNKEVRKALLIRDPRDELVSFYYHIIGRKEKKNLPTDYSLRQFLETYELGIDGLIVFLNIWAPAVIRGRSDIKAFMYEDFLGPWSVSGETWTSFVEYITARPINFSAIQRAVHDNEITRLKKRLEAAGPADRRLTGLGGRIRKGTANSFSSELAADEILYIERRLKEKLNEDALRLLGRYLE